MGDRMEWQPDTPDSAQNAEPTQNPGTAQGSIYKNNGPLLEVETLQQDLTITSNAPGTSAPSKEPIEKPEGVTNLYMNQGLVYKGKTITGSLNITHTVGNPSQ